MIESESTPLDLAYDQFLRVLYQMEFEALGHDCARAQALGYVIDVVLDLIGGHRGFTTGLELALSGRLDTKSQVDPVLVCEALGRSQPMVEAMRYVRARLCDAPAEGTVLRGRRIIENAQSAVQSHIQRFSSVAA